MRPLTLLFFALLLAPRCSIGQDNQPNPGQPNPSGFQSPIVIEPIQLVDQPLIAPTQPITDKQTYVVKVVEFRFKTPPARNLLSQEILDQFSNKDNDQIEQVESISLSALAGYESTAHYGKSTSVTTAVSGPRWGGSSGPQQGGPQQGSPGRPDLPSRQSVRQTQQRSLGTILRVTATTQENLVLVKLQYEASRIVGEIPEDTVPDNQMVRYQSTLLVDPGKLTLLSGSTSKDNTYLVLLVEKN